MSIDLDQGGNYSKPLGKTISESSLLNDVTFTINSSFNPLLLINDDRIENRFLNSLLNESYSVFSPKPKRPNEQSFFLTNSIIIDNINQQHNRSNTIDSGSIGLIRFTRQLLETTTTSGSITSPQAISTTTEINLEQLMGPIREPYHTVILMTIVYLAILVTGVSGNLITCLVIARKRYMHTATNYYLFSLAVSDLMLLILGLPQDLVLLWRKYPYMFSESFCVMRGLTSELSTNASILTITAFTIERYVAICHPLKSHTMLKLARVIRTIIIIWMIGAICALPIAWQFGIVYALDERNNPIAETDQCSVKILLYPYIFEITTMAFFLVPIMIITVLYILIGIKLRASSKDTNNNNSSHSHNHINNHPSPHQHHHKKSGPANQKKNFFGRNPNLGQQRSIYSSSSIMYRSSNYQLQQQPKLSDIDPQPSMVEVNHTLATSNHHHRQPLSLSIRRQNAGRRAVIKMLVAVVISFFFCYLPFHMQRCFAMMLSRSQMTMMMTTIDDTSNRIMSILTHISGVTYYLSSTINPILYQVMSKKFQQALRETLPCLCSFCFQTPKTTGTMMMSRNSQATISGGHQNSLREQKQRSRRQPLSPSPSVLHTRASPIDHQQTKLEIGFKNDDLENIEKNGFDDVPPPSNPSPKMTRKISKVRLKEDGVM